MDSLKRNSRPHKPKKNNIIILTQLIEGIKEDYIEYKKELKLLSLYKKILNTYKENNKDNDNYNNDNNNNIEEMRNMYNSSFNNCTELIKKIKNNKDTYFSCLNNLKEFIKLVNSFNTSKNENFDESNIIDNNRNLLYIQEKDYIEKIIINMDQFIETLNYNLNENILDFSLKNELNL